jgi:hypothetical protein
MGWYRKLKEEAISDLQLPRSVPLILWKRSRKPWVLITETENWNVCVVPSVGAEIKAIIENLGLRKDRNFEYTQQHSRAASSPANAGRKSKAVQKTGGSKASRRTKA